MSLHETPVVQLTQRALKKHLRTAANGPKTLRPHSEHTDSERECSLPTTYLGSADQTEPLDEIRMDPERKREIMLEIQRSSELLSAGDQAKPMVHKPIDLVDNRPLCTRTFFLPHLAPQVLPEQNTPENGTLPPLSTPNLLNTPPKIEPAIEEIPQKSINSSPVSARLIKPSSAQDDQLRNVLPSHFPQFRHVQDNRELGFYLDRSQYAISVGSGPLDDLHYGIIIVPIGEEHMLFRSEFDSREIVLATQQKPSLRSVEGAQPKMTDTAPSAAAQDSMVDHSSPSTHPHAPLKHHHAITPPELKLTHLFPLPQSYPHLRRQHHATNLRHTDGQDGHEPDREIENDEAARLQELIAGGIKEEKKEAGHGKMEG